MAYIKKAEDVVSVSSIDFSLNVTVQSVQEKTYVYNINDKEVTSTKLLVALGNLDATDPFHTQIFLYLSPKSDPAYPLLASAKAGDQGVASFKLSVALCKSSTDAHGELSYVQTSTLSVQDFQKEGDQ